MKTDIKNLEASYRKLFEYRQERDLLIKTGNIIQFSLIFNGHSSMYIDSELRRDLFLAAKKAAVQKQAGLCTDLLNGLSTDGLDTGDLQKELDGLIERVTASVDPPPKDD